jgi:hypothetical protein
MEVADLGQPRVDYISDAWNRNRSLCDVGRNNELADALVRGNDIEGSQLLLWSHGGV